MNTLKNTLIIANHFRWFEKISSCFQAALSPPPQCYCSVCGSISRFILSLGAWNFINSVKVLYAVPKCPTCPVKMLLLTKTDQHAIIVCVKDALISPSSWHMVLWQASQKQSFRGSIWDICKSVKCQISYTLNCLRATAISFINDAGFQARHIMFMSRHRCKASLKTYNRNMSADRKRKTSSVWRQ